MKIVRRTRHPDPISTYIEWTTHRYDPGYYLGGNPPPHLQVSLGPKARRLAGWLLGVVAFTSTASVMALSDLEPWWGLLADASLAGLTAFAAVKMYRSGATTPRGK
jgi:hypothetical protein